MFTSLNVSHVTCHVSHVMCHVSHIVCHMSFIYIYFFLDKVMELVVEGLVSTGPTPSSFFEVYTNSACNYYIIKTCTPIGTNLPRPWWILMKINDQTSIEPKYSVFYSNDKVRDHALSLVFWLEKELR